MPSSGTGRALGLSAVSSADAIDGCRDGLHAAGAVARDGLGRNGARYARAQRDDPRDVGGIERLRNAAENRFVNQLGIDPRARQQGIDGRPAEFDRTICYDDLSTGGSIMVFGPGRDVVEVATEFMRFFADESCGYCTPCRVGNVLMLKKLEEILAGKGEAADLEYLTQLGIQKEDMALIIDHGLDDHPHQGQTFVLFTIEAPDLA